MLELSSSGAVVRTTTSSRSGATGSVRAPSWTQPMSAGGKLTAKGTSARQSDQLDGRIDNVVLTIG